MKYLKICILLLLVAGFCYQCNPSGTETDTYSVNTIVYGDVSRFDNSVTNANTGVQIFYYPNGCDSLKITGELGFGLVEESGRYRFVLKQAFIKNNSDCYKARLINFAGGDTELVDGPKEFIPLFRDDPPYDSVRVDFSYPDSLR